MIYKVFSCSNCKILCDALELYLLFATGQLFMHLVRHKNPRNFMFQRAVAQLVEQRSPKPQVAGSSPVRPAFKPRKIVF